MNERFRRSPYAADQLEGWDMLGAAGLMVHVLDSWEDQEKPWRSKDAGKDLASSIVHAGQHGAGGVMPIYRGGGAGFILRPGATPIKCGNGGETGRGECQGWCPSISVTEWLDDNWRRTPVNGDNCRQGSWRPADFPAYLRRQEKWQLLNHRLEHNEIIVDKWQWNNALPRIIDAFFVTKGQQPAHMAELHKQFLAEYGLAEEICPMVALDPYDWENPIGLEFPAVNWNANHRNRNG